MLKGHVKSHNVGTGTGLITPEITGRDVFFLGSVVEGGGKPHTGQPVEYELYEGGGEPEAKRVVLR